MSASKRSSTAVKPAASKAAGASRLRMKSSVATKVAGKLLAVPPAKLPSRSSKVVATSAAAFLDVDPFVAAIRRHVAIEPKVARMLRRDLRQAFEQAVRQMGKEVRPRSVDEAADPVLSTQEAADLVGVSRPFMAARIDMGDIPLHQQVGNQRRVLKSAVLKWQDQSRQRQGKALSSLARNIDDEYGGED